MAYVLTLPFDNIYLLLYSVSTFYYRILFNRFSYVKTPIFTWYGYIMVKQKHIKPTLRKYIERGTSNLKEYIKFINQLTFTGIWRPACFIRTWRSRNRAIIKERLNKFQCSRLYFEQENQYPTQEFVSFITILQAIKDCKNHQK